MKSTIKIYKGYTVQCLMSGWYSTKSNNLGYLKSNSLTGIKKMIDGESRVEDIKDIKQTAPLIATAHLLPPT